jgi:hypothetical protein
MQVIFSTVTGLAVLAGFALSRPVLEPWPRIIFTAAIWLLAIWAMAYLLLSSKSTRATELRLSLVQEELERLAGLDSLARTTPKSWPRPLMQSLLMISSGLVATGAVWQQPPSNGAPVRAAAPPTADSTVLNVPANPVKAPTSAAPVR